MIPLSLLLQALDPISSEAFFAQQHANAAGVVDLAFGRVQLWHQRLACVAG